MRRKWLVVVGLVVTVVIIAGLLFLQLQITKSNQLEDALVKTVQAFSSDQIDFSGTLITDSPYPISADFQTTINKNASKTSMSVYLLSDTKNSIKAEVISIDGKRYLKILNATDVADKLGDDPLSRSISANIQPLVKQYQNKWIELDQETDAPQSIQCWKSLLGYDTKEELLRASFKKYPFLTLVSEDRTALDGSRVVRYELSPNDQTDDFITAVFGKSQNINECNNSFGKNEKLFITMDEEGSLKEVRLKNEATTIVLKPTTHTEQTSIEQPQTKLKFSDLKKLIDSLFLQ